MAYGYCVCRACHGRGGTFGFPKSVFAPRSAVRGMARVWSRCEFCKGRRTVFVNFSESEELVALRETNVVPEEFRFPQAIAVEAGFVAVRYPEDRIALDTLGLTGFKAELLKLHIVCEVYQKLFSGLRLPPGMLAHRYMLQVADWFWRYKVYFPT